MPSERKCDIIVFAPHPGDEALGCAGLIYAQIKKGRNVKLVLITNGDSDWESWQKLHHREPRNEDMIELGYKRQKKTMDAMDLLGLNGNDILFLGYPENFLSDILLSDEYSDINPFKSSFTGLNFTAYENSYSKNVPYCRASFIGDIDKILSQYNPKRVYITHPKDGDGDHRSSGMIIRDIVKDMKKPFAVYGYYVSYVRKSIELKAKQKRFLKATRKLREITLDKETKDVKKKCIRRYKTKEHLLVPLSVYFNDTESFWRLM
ncbi:MAG: PIG-L family deacetylase [Thermoplasmata archaeon]|nr:MAG: PIG-L family deacetylase [Thermoplasmata archaeon]